MGRARDLQGSGTCCKAIPRHQMETEFHWLISGMTSPWSLVAPSAMPDGRVTRVLCPLPPGLHGQEHRSGCLGSLPTA